MKQNNQPLLYFIALSVALLVQSCGIYGSYQRPEEFTSSKQLYRSLEDTTDTLAYTWQEGDSLLADLPWKAFFRSPSLQQLIDTALVRNADLRKAELDVAKAKAMLQSAGLSFAPDLAFAPSIKKEFHAKGFVEGESLSLPLASSWEIDILGKNLNRYRQAVAHTQMAKDYSQAVRASIIAAVATQYYTLEMLDQQLAIANNTATLWQENLRAIKLLKETGRATEPAVARAEAQVHQVEKTRLELLKSIRETENAIALILQQSPRKVQRSGTTSLSLDDRYAVGPSLLLLTNRPDVRAAEMQLAASYYGVNHARASFLPSLTLSATGSWINPTNGAFTDPLRFVGNLLASLTQPLFAKGKLTAQLKVAKANFEQAKIDYQSTLLAATTEVSNALYEYQTQQQILQQYEEWIRSLARAVDTSKQLLLYSTGSYLEVISAQQQLFATQLGEVAERFKLNLSLIKLYRSLGGGCEVIE